MELDRQKLKQVAAKADLVIQSPKRKQILEYLAGGDRISYIGTDQKYRSGGFVLKIAPDGTRFSLKGGALTFSVQTENIDTLYIRKKE